MAQTRAGRLQLRQFRFTEPTAEPQTMVEIHAIPEKGPVVFTPLATRWMKAAALSLAVSEDHIVLDGVDLRYPYVVGVTPSIPIETLSPEREEELLWVPPELRRVTDQLVDELCPPEASTREKAVAVSQFFQNQFDYSLEHSTRAGRREPIEHFLRSRHPAHCEYFATATALILRRAGVPTRYVTGYVMAELDPRDRSWIARNGNAHAWVEAYDRHASQWFPVESTPGRQYQTLRSGRVPDIANNSADPATPQADKRDTKSWYQRLGQWLQGLQWASALALILRIAGVPLLVFLILLLWRMIREEGRAGLAPIDFRSLEMLRSVNRRIERHGLVRADQETLHQFAHRLDAEAEQVGGAKAEELHQAAAWYRRYASARYRGLEPQPFSLRAAV